MKSFAKPPPLVETVLSSVCLLMGMKENWDEAKKLMNKSSFLDDLKTYDKDALTANTKLTGKLQKYMKNEDFQPDKVGNVSKACKSLCCWVSYVPNHGDLFFHLINQISRLILAVKDSLRSSTTP